MLIIRRAATTDYPAIYQLQQSTFRDNVFAYPQDSVEKFVERTTKAVEEGKEHYFVLAEQAEIDGFVWHQKDDDGHWFTAIWGKWLKTLTYGVAYTCFENLNFPRILFFIREQNSRMLKVARDYRWRMIGETSSMVLREQEPCLVMARIQCFEVKSDEYFADRDFYIKQSMPVQFVL
jgi:hypothetical protein